MKLLFYIIASFLPLAVYCQEVKIISNVSKQEQKESIILNSIEEEYTLLIGYIEESYWWSDRIYYCVLAQQKEEWYFLTITSKKQRRSNEFSQPKVRKKRIDKVKPEIENLLNRWNELSFFDLDQDSLNIQSRQINDSVNSVFSISDGINYRIEIITDKEYRRIEAYEPQYFLEKIPEVTIRERFIEGVQLLNKIIDKVGG